MQVHASSSMLSLQITSDVMNSSNSFFIQMAGVKSLISRYETNTEALETEHKGKSRSKREGTPEKTQPIWSFDKKQEKARGKTQEGKGEERNLEPQELKSEPAVPICTDVSDISVELSLKEQDGLPSDPEEVIQEEAKEEVKEDATEEATVKATEEDPEEAGTYKDNATFKPALDLPIQLICTLIPKQVSTAGENTTLGLQEATTDELIERDYIHDLEKENQSNALTSSRSSLFAVSDFESPSTVELFERISIATPDTPKPNSSKEYKHTASPSLLVSTPSVPGLLPSIEFRNLGAKNNGCEKSAATLLVPAHVWRGIAKQDASPTRLITRIEDTIEDTVRPKKTMRNKLRRYVSEKLKLSKSQPTRFVYKNPLSPNCIVRSVPLGGSTLISPPEITRNSYPTIFSGDYKRALESSARFTWMVNSSGFSSSKQHFFLHPPSPHTPRPKSSHSKSSKTSRYSKYFAVKLVKESTVVVPHHEPDEFSESPWWKDSDDIINSFQEYVDRCLK